MMNARTARIHSLRCPGSPVGRTQHPPSRRNSVRPSCVGLRQHEHPQRRHDMASDGRLNYSVYSGRRAVSVKKAWSGAEAVIEYLTAMGCKGSELVTLGPNSVTWRGATFTAVPVVAEPGS